MSFMGPSRRRTRSPEHIITDINYDANVVACLCGWMGPAYTMAGQRETPYNLHAGHVERDLFREELSVEEPSRQEGIDVGYKVLWDIITGKLPLPGEMEQA